MREVSNVQAENLAPFYLKRSRVWIAERTKVSIPFLKHRTGRWLSSFSIRRSGIRIDSNPFRAKDPNRAWKPRGPWGLFLTINFTECRVNLSVDPSACICFPRSERVRFSEAALNYSRLMGILVLITCVLPSPSLLSRKKEFYFRIYNALSFERA